MGLVLDGYYFPIYYSYYNFRNHTMATTVNKSFAQIYFDNFVKTSLSVTAFLALYLIAQHYGLHIVFLAGLAATSVIAFILTLIQILRKKT